MPAFNNLAAILLVAIPALLNIGILLYIVFYLPKGKAVNVFAAFILGLICWQSLDFISRLDVPLETVQYADNLFSIGWLSTGVLLFHFVLYHTKQFTLDSRRIFLFLYLPLLIVHAIYINHPATESYAHDDFWGWIQLDLDIVEQLVRYFVSFFVILSIVMLFHHAYKKRTQKEVKFQSILIATGILIPTIAGLISQVIYPLTTGYEVPVTSSFFTFISIATIISMSRNQLFSITDSINIEKILENLSGMVLIIDPDQNVIFKNIQARKHIDTYSRSTKFDKVQHYFPDESTYEQFYTEVFEKAMRGDAVTQYDSQFKSANEHIMDVSISSELITNNNIKQGVLLIATDITKRKKAEKERIDILNSITDGFFAVDRNWKVTYWNRAAEEILLMPRENVEGKNLWDIYSDAVPLKFYSEYHKSMENEEVRVFEEYYPTMKLWFQVSVFPKKDGLAVYFKDITNDKKQELEILRIKQNREAMINSTDEMIWSVNKDFCLITANTAFNKMVQEMTGEMLEEGDNVLTGGFDEDKRIQWKKLYRRALSGERFTITNKLEFEGKEFYYLISFNPIYNNQGKCTGVACYSKDISERMKYINAIERQNERLKSIAWTQSHVVRAPLSRLMGLVNIIKMGAIEEQELDEYLNHLRAAAKELDEIIHEIVEKTKEVSN